MYKHLTYYKLLTFAFPFLCSPVFFLFLFKALSTSSSLFLVFLLQWLAIACIMSFIHFQLADVELLL